MKKVDYAGIGESVYFDKLDNGLGIFVVKKEGFAKKYAYFATNYGGVDRRFKFGGQWIDTPMGVAHFLEHKMFDMPEGNALNTLASNGASPNAYTSLDITAYHFESVDNFWENLETLLKFVSTPYFTKESVMKEQGIIGQEIGMVNDNPGTELYYGLLRCLYKDHPRRENIVGTVESIAQITEETLYACHKMFYNPKNMVLCVVGDVDPDMVYDMAKRIITQPGEEITDRDYGRDEGLGPYEKRFRRKMQVASPLFFLGGKIKMPKGGEDYLKTLIKGQIAAEVLAGASSPLYNNLYSKGLVMSDFSGEFEAVADTAYIVFGGEARDVSGAVEMIYAEAEKIAEHGIDKDYYDRIIKSMIGAELRGLNRFDDICYNVARGYFRDYDAMRASDIIRTISREEVESFIKDHVNENYFALSVIEPQNA